MKTYFSVEDDLDWGCVVVWIMRHHDGAALDVNFFGLYTIGLDGIE